MNKNERLIKITADKTKANVRNCDYVAGVTDDEVMTLEGGDHPHNEIILGKLRHRTRIRFIIHRYKLHKYTMHIFSFYSFLTLSLSLCERIQK